ncbi:MAG: cupin domain-containing protein [Rhizobiaceae bacterium]
MHPQNLTPATIISLLNLTPHPEGGWYTQTFRDTGPDSRGNSTAIYFLLEGGKPSHWHKVHGSSEVWLYHAGAPIRLKLSEDGKTETHHMLGVDLIAGERPQLIVPPGWWQAAETTGEWTLVSCTVAPGFLFENFELAEAGWKPG